MMLCLLFVSCCCFFVLFCFVLFCFSKFRKVIWYRSWLEKVARLLEIVSSLNRCQRSVDLEDLWGAFNFLVSMCRTVFKSRVCRADFFLKKKKKKNLGTWEWIFAKNSVCGAKIMPKSERNGPKNAELFEKRKTEGIRTDTRCKRVGLWSGGEAGKGVVKAVQSGTYP